MKNFRIDVILEEERRSASPVSIKLAARIAGIAVAAIILLVATIFVGGVLRLKAQASRINDDWKELEPQWEQAKQDKKEYEKNKAILDEIKGWNKSRIEWHKHLMQIMDVIPQGVELDKMAIKGSIGVADDHAAMQFGMVMDGAAREDKKNKSYARSPQEDVMEFEKLLNTAPFAKTMLANVEVPPQFFTDDKAAGASKQDRKFKIVVSYKPRKFLNETSKK
jgi:hypothetical protein